MAQKRRRKRRKRRGCGLLLGLMVMAGVAFGAWRLLKAPTEGLYPEDVLGVPVYTQLAPEGAQNRPGTKREIRYIVIHETGNTAAGADAAAHGQLEAKGGEGTTGWHYTVDDTEVWHSIPDDEVAYHAGDGAEGLLAQVAAGIKDKGFAHGDASPYGSSWFSPVTALPVSSAVK